MAEANVVIETNEVEVTAQMVPTREFDRVRRAVCLLMPVHDSSTDDSGNSWSASGFYIRMRLCSKKMQASKKKQVNDVCCIITNHHVFRMTENASNKIMAVFDHEGDGGPTVEVHLQPFKILASNKDLDYALICVNAKTMSSLQIEPIDAHGLLMPQVNHNVYIIQHPKGLEKHFSTDRIRRIVPPFLEYYADTMRGSSGSPVLIASDCKFVLVALHCKGVENTLIPESWNKGVLISEILSHLNTGTYTDTVGSAGIPGQLETGVTIPPLSKGSKDPKSCVSDEDIRQISVYVVNVWMPLGRGLGLDQSAIVNINLDHNTAYEKTYQMFLKWKRTKVKHATYGALWEALCHPSVGRGDLIPK